MISPPRMELEIRRILWKIIPKRCTWVKRNPKRWGFFSRVLSKIHRLLSKTFIGKLKTFCPSLYIKLLSWECDFLDNSFPTTTLPSNEVVNDSKYSTSFGDSISDSNRNPVTTPPLFLLLPCPKYPRYNPWRLMLLLPLRLLFYLRLLHYFILL